ncbi:hypothetical protein PUN28_012916 [Cardiocondyla obscurior]|uniref:Uncharacterized protein n=1 Tax=Cardiocondyla obscurior TaxID=286306 RepID=A0AAW2F8Z8_9HYME
MQPFCESTRPKGGGEYGSRLPSGALDIRPATLQDFLILLFRVNLLSRQLHTDTYKLTRMPMPIQSVTLSFFLRSFYHRAGKTERSEVLTNDFENMEGDGERAKKELAQGKENFSCPRVDRCYYSRRSSILTNIQTANFASSYRVQDHKDACTISPVVEFRNQMQTQFTRNLIKRSRQCFFCSCICVLKRSTLEKFTRTLRSKSSGSFCSLAVLVHKSHIVRGIFFVERHAMSESASLKKEKKKMKKKYNQ